MRLVQDRCPHRGTSLAYGWVEGDSIRCRYHGWKFDGSGQGEDFPAETATYAANIRSEEHTSELQSLMRISYAVFCLKKTNDQKKAQATAIYRRHAPYTLTKI